MGTIDLTDINFACAPSKPHDENDHLGNHENSLVHSHECENVSGCGLQNYKGNWNMLSFLYQMFS